jgi:hypothetical protein
MSYKVPDWIERELKALPTVPDEPKIYAHSAPMQNGLILEGYWISPFEISPKLTIGEHKYRAGKVGFVDVAGQWWYAHRFGPE